MVLFWILLLGVVQGITEFLPISSKGHLSVLGALVERFTGHDLPNQLELNIVLHAGTLVSILVVFRRQIWRILVSDHRMMGLVIVGTLPAVAAGLLIHKTPWLKPWLTSPLLTGCLLPVTGLLLILGSRHGQGTTDETTMSYRQALTVGLFQVMALLPGISRSGTTIVGGLLVGLRPQTAATFSFLLAIPAIAGGVVLELKDVLTSAHNENLGALLLGAVVSCLVGIIALRWLLSWLKRGHLAWFAWWCIPAGLAVVAWQLLDPAAGYGVLTGTSPDE